MSIPFEPIRIADWAWQRPETRQILAGRNVAALLRFAQRYGGASQGRLATATGIGQGRINEIIHGKRDVAQLDVFTRIADGINMPDDARMTLGLAPQQPDNTGRGTVSAEIARLFPNQEPLAEEIRRRGRDAAELDVLAVRGLGIIGLNDSLLRPVLLARTAPLLVRVLLLDPTCPAAVQRANEISESPDSFAAGIQLSLTRLREVANTPNVDLEVRLYTRLPVWRIIRIDDMVYVSSFDAAWEGHESAVYEIPHTPRGAFWAGFRRHFDDVHASAERVI
jgi:transcriptional regulator with XRE-family HTH domain